MLAFNTAYSQDYSRCWEIVIEDVSGSGIKAKVVLADNAKSIHNGTQGRVDPWKGQLDPSGSTLRFVSGDGETSYELQLKGSAAMEGKVVYPNGTGKLWLSKR